MAPSQQPAKAAVSSKEEKSADLVMGVSTQLSAHWIEDAKSNLLRRTTAV